LSEYGAAFIYRLTPMAAGTSFPQRVLDEVGPLPGVAAATVAFGMPMLRTDTVPFRTDAQPASADADWNQTAWVCPISPDYFRTFGTPVLEGRAFTKHDRVGSPPVVVVNRGLASKYWPTGDAVGRYLTLTVFTGPRPAQRTFEVIGVVGDVRAWPVMGTEFAIYTALAQDRRLDELPMDGGWGLDYRIAVRLANSEAATVRAVTAAIHRVDPAVPIENTRFMPEVLGQAFAPWRVLMRLLIVMGAAAVLLACIGIYGVTTYVMTQRTHELGVRVALGATPADILVPSLTRGAVLALVGSVVGVLPGYWFNRLLANRLYDVSPADPLTLVAVSVLLMVVTLVAVWWPARKAATADPLTALRCE
jgi:predicted permease